MKRCCFLGLMAVYDSELLDRISEELEKIIATEDKIEFWFYKPNMSYERSCLSLAIWLRSKYPNKDISIVRVFDPILHEKPVDWYDETFNTRFPRCIPDRNIFAPTMDDDREKIKDRMIQRGNRVDRWIISQCNTIIAYYYPDLDSSVNQDVKYAQKQKDTTVIQISFEETEHFIQEQINSLLDDRTKSILLMRKSGKTNAEIAKIIGVSNNRIGQIVSEAARDIRHALMEREKEKKKNRNKDSKQIMRCGLAGLSDKATSRDLVIFESLLKHLVEDYNIEEFWIDKDSCDSAYGAILAMFCKRPSSYSGPHAKVYVRIENDDVDEWKRLANKYVPPYASVEHIGRGDSDWESICRDAIRQCYCFITDFSRPEAATIRKLCGEDGGVYLFDISSDKLAIVEQSEST